MSTSANFDYLQYISSTVDQKVVIRELMGAYGGDVWNFAFALARSPEHADAITQEAFVRAYRALPLFRGESSVKAWLLALTHSAAGSVKTSLLQRLPLRGKSGGADDPDNDRMNASWRTVMELPAKLREVLILSAHHRLTIAEIAYVLDISEETAKSRLHQARLKAIEAKGG
ncbi:RNA polymerase sigma factor [Paenibacillus chartarius]|uniref:RNA polymerase sigma factor n=1 Tax=Paenibacillus chartarius TaxID=747481 RepID=A0ABV6DMP9_9BACL